MYFVLHVMYFVFKMMYVYIKVPSIITTTRLGRVTSTCMHQHRKSSAFSAERVIIILGRPYLPAVIGLCVRHDGFCIKNDVF